MARPLCLLALLLAACLGPEQPPIGASGAEIYALQLCANCHGAAGEGTRRGPPLRGMTRYWTRDGLAGFLADPDAWEARDPRLAHLAAGYSGDMDRYDNLSAEERARLAQHVLDL